MQNDFAQIKSHQIYRDLLLNVPFLKHAFSDYYLNTYENINEYQNNLAKRQNENYFNLAIRKYPEEKKLETFSDLKDELGGVFLHLINKENEDIYLMENEMRYLQDREFVKVVINKFNQYQTKYEGEVLKGSSIPYGRGRMIKEIGGEPYMIYEGWHCGPWK